MSIPISQFIPLPTYAFYNYKNFPHLWLYFCFVNRFLFYHLLDSAYKQCHMIFVFLCLTSLRRTISRSIHVAPSGIIFSLLCAMFSRSVVSDSLWPHGLYPTRLLCPWGVSRQEYWNGLPCPPPGDLPNPGIKPRSSALQTDWFFTVWAVRKPSSCYGWVLYIYLASFY